MASDLPRPSLALVVVIQSVLGVLLLGGVGAIVFLPGTSANIAATFPEYADLRGPMLALSIAITVLALVALAMVAVLVHRSYRGTVRTRSSLLWIDVIVTTLACTVVLVIISFIVISNAQAGTPLLALMQVAACLALIALAWIALSLRSRLGHSIPSH
ncbi:hypothetical protein B1729_10425 [Microbacterium sp. B35-04]|jgi:hypothetical protein|uniref:DUF2975 domain-containing protein n=1 Tax=Microbacterium sp. B35-04 TaxID=1961716 RepID=UPI0013D663D7|nr:DUF2975 domain-containing protein [Microbacterium sp. B35-04]KAF2413355.1 hypothetical protein B1729_10425 [Microbacterium sp. B35-04]